MKEFAFIMVGTEDALKDFQEADKSNLEKWFDEHSSSYDVGKYAKDVLDMSLLSQVENWGCYIVLTEKEYDLIR